MRSRWIIKVFLWTALGSGTASQAAPLTADVIVLMDESGSMSGEQAWIKGVVTNLNTQLESRGLSGNQFGTVGFAVGGDPGLTRSLPVGGGQFGTAAQFQAVTYSTGGGTEDGWAAINRANQYTFRAGAARNYILVTDEDRDNALASLTYAGILASLTGSSTLLNAVLDAQFSCGTQAALGIDSKGNGYVADGSGGYTTCGNPTVVGGAGSTVANYVDLALASGGAAWDLSFLRAGGANAQSFSLAFADIKVQEIEDQVTIPEPSTYCLVGAALGLLAAAKRKACRA